MEQYQAQIIEQVNQGILQVAQEEERQLDARLQKLEQLDEDDFEALRQRRKQMLMKQTRQEQDWRQLGHGSYTELTDPKEFFNAAKKSQRMVVHFSRPVTPRCEIVDAHMQRLAERHLETRFVKINVEKNTFLAERLGVVMLPTIVIIKDGKTDHSLRGFDELGGTDDFSTDDLAFVLSQHGALNFEADKSEEIAQRSRRAGLNSMQMKVRRGQYDDLSDDENFDD